MEFVRIGDKLISKAKIAGMVDRILGLRSKGYSQQEVARQLGVDRSFISRIETMGEVRKGRTMAIVGFPVLNKEEIEGVAREEGVDFVFLLTERERREFVINRSGLELFNELMRLIYQARQYDALILLGSDRRLDLMKGLFDGEVVCLEIGKSPILQDVYVEPQRIRSIVRELRSRESELTEGK